MLILLVFGLVIGILLFSVLYDDMLGFAIICSIVLLLAFIGVLCIYIDAANEVLKYEQVKAVYQDLCNNDYITGEEYRTIAPRIISVNSEIQIHRYWSSNVWVGVFAPKQIADLELLDIERLPKTRE